MAKHVIISSSYNAIIGNPPAKSVVIGPLWESRFTSSQITSKETSWVKKTSFYVLKPRKKIPDEIEKVFICINFQERICMYYILKNEGWLASLGTIVVTPRDSG